jgi:hypothetical protein
MFASMLRAGVIVVRTSYLLAALTSLALSTPPLAELLYGGSWPLLSPRTSLSSLLWSAALILVFMVLPLRGAWRLVRHHELVPESHIRERPYVATLVVLASQCSNFLLLLVAWVLLTTLPESGDVNIAGPAVLALMLLAIALLVGEVVLVGRMRAARP